MTIREFLLKHLTDNGLWPDEAETVVQGYEQDEKSMEGRWSDDIEGYPKVMWAALIVCVNGRAVRWIEANKPLHWAKPMFTGEADGL